MYQHELGALKSRGALFCPDNASLNLSSYDTIILVDDGIATGATMKAAIRAIKQGTKSKIICAVPVASVEAKKRIETEEEVDVLSLLVPTVFYGVGSFYERFDQTEDNEVIELLTRAKLKQ